jgi:hypothetical protein
VAVSQANFAAGHSVRSSMMHLQPQQLAGAQVVPHPMVTPDRTMVSPGTTRAVPPRAARPTLTSHEDAAIRAGSTPRTESNQPTGGSSATGSPTRGGQPAPIERRGFQAAQPNQQPGNRGNPAPATQSQGQPQNEQPTYRNNPASGISASGNPANGAQQSGQQNYRNNSATGNPATGNPAQGAQPQPNGQQSPGMTIQGGVRPSNGVRGTEQLPSAAAPTPRAQAPQAQGQLYNRAVPPPTRPSFEQQRQAIQNTDPGRPLSPQQMDNLRENRPAGQQQVREPAPHPMPQEQHNAPPPQQRSSPPPEQRSSPPPRSDNNKH